jgi:hypothetical protein
MEDADACDRMKVVAVATATKNGECVKPLRLTFELQKVRAWIMKI